MKIEGRVTRLEATTRGPGCAVCRQWQVPAVVCVPDAGDGWQRHLPYPVVCPECGRAVYRRVKVLVGVDIDQV